MYKLLSIKEYEATRDVYLKNVITETTDMCFDDSALVSESDNFDFMEIGKQYECKIRLFGETDISKLGELVECLIVEDNIKVGRAIYVKVKVNNDSYYVDREQAIPFLATGKFKYRYTRKDLIQVGDIMHQDLW